MANPTGSNYLYQTAVLKELGKPSSEQAIPSIETPATEYMQGRSLAEAAALKNQSDFDFNEAMLEEKGRQFMQNLIFGQDQLREFARQNDLATMIGIGNIAVQGVAGYAQNERMAKQEEIQNDILETYKALPGTVSLANAARAKEWETGVGNKPLTKAKKQPLNIETL